MVRIPPELTLASRGKTLRQRRGQTARRVSCPSPIHSTVGPSPSAAAIAAMRSSTSRIGLAARAHEKITRPEPETRRHRAGDNPEYEETTEAGSAREIPHRFELRSRERPVEADGESRAPPRATSARRMMPRRNSTDGRRARTRPTRRSAVETSLYADSLSRSRLPSNACRSSWNSGIGRSPTRSTSSRPPTTRTAEGSTATPSASVSRTVSAKPAPSLPTEPGRLSTNTRDSRAPTVAASARRPINPNANRIRRRDGGNHVNRATLSLAHHLDPDGGPRSDRDERPGQAADGDLAPVDRHDAVSHEKAGPGRRPVFLQLANAGLKVAVLPILRGFPAAVVAFLDPYAEPATSLGGRRFLSRAGRGGQRRTQAEGEDEPPGRGHHVSTALARPSSSVRRSRNSTSSNRYALAKKSPGSVSS